MSGRGKAFIFDLDGTLVDAFRAYEEAYRKTFERAGLEYRDGALAPFYGQADLDVLRKMLAEDVADDEVMRLLEFKRDYYLKTAYKMIRIFPCATDVIRILKSKNIKVAVATSCQRSATEVAVDKMKVGKLLDCVVTGTDVARGKPDPELFLKAAKMMRVKPDECVVVEDSLHGIEAGKRAGMKTVAVLTGKTRKKDIEKLYPDIIINNLCELIPLIEKGQFL